MRKITKAALAGGVAAATIAAPLVGAGTANAESGETYFLSLQVAHGWQIWDPAAHVAKAYSVCNRLGYESGIAVINEVYYENGSWAWETAHSFVNDAATALCPWTWTNSPNPTLLLRAS